LVASGLPSKGLGVGARFAASVFLLSLAVLGLAARIRAGRNEPEHAGREQHRNPRTMDHAR
jgi:hypothetical protein